MEKLWFTLLSCNVTPLHHPKREFKITYKGRQVLHLTMNQIKNNS